MSTFKLVVISPFNNYQRGSEIRDQVIVNSILDKKSSMHHFSKNCRRVSFIDKQQYIPPSQPEAPKPVNEEPPVNIPEVEPVNLPPQDTPEVEADMELSSVNLLDDLEDRSINLSSVKDNDSDAGRPDKNLRRKR